MNENIISQQMSFLISECRCKEFTLTEFAKLNKKEIPFDKYLFNLSIGLAIKKEEKKVSIELGVRIFSSADPKEQLIFIDSIHSFFIKNFDEITVANKVGEQVGLPEPVILPLLAIAISNLRGIISVKLEDTLYSNMVLPVMDMAKILPKKQTMIG